MAENDIELSIDELFNRTSQEVMEAIVTDKLVKTGTYIGTVNKVFAKRNGPDSEWDAGREVASLATVLSDDNAERVGEVFIKVSWQPKYTVSGNLDNASKRFGELSKALGCTGEASPGEVLQTAKSEGFKVRVRETYKLEDPNDLHESHASKRPSSDGTYWIALKADEDEARSHYIGLGYEPSTMVDRITKL